MHFQIPITPDPGQSRSLKVSKSYNPLPLAEHETFCCDDFRVAAGGRKRLSRRTSDTRLWCSYVVLRWYGYSPACRDSRYRLAGDICLGLGVHKKCHNETVKTQNFGENENQNHTDEQSWLLRSSTHTK